MLSTFHAIHVIHASENQYRTPPPQNANSMPPYQFHINPIPISYPFIVSELQWFHIHLSQPRVPYSARGVNGVLNLGVKIPFPLSP